MTRRFICVTAIVAAAGLTAACGATSKHADPPTLVPWSRVGGIHLGETFKQVRADYGPGRGYGGYGYRRHGGYLRATSYVSGNRVTVIDVSSRYYRTKDGFGVGSTFPRRWRHAFLYNPSLKANPCHCWVKIGSGRRSLRPGPGVFLKPWVIVYLSHGRVSDILISSKYLD